MTAYIIIGIVLAFLLLILIRTFMFTPKPEKELAAEKIKLNEEKIVEDMVDMIKCKTVSYRDDEKQEKEEFIKFENILKERFPNINEKCTFKKIGKTGILYHLKGKTDEKPSVCMAHYDVVPALENDWDTPAFEGIIKDGNIIGRGTLDTKSTLCGIFQALEQLLSEGFVPENDLYISLSGEEEIDGNSCADIVSYLEEKGIKPAIVLDEGGAVVENVFPGVKEECALIGIGEKGGVNIDFSLKSKGGHASTPPTKTVTNDLADAIVKLHKKPFKRQLTKPVLEMFNILGRHSSFLYRMIFANLWCFLPLLDLIAKLSGGEMNAMLRTTTAVTKMQGSEAYNVLPPSASFGVNMRLLGKDTIDTAISHLKKTIKNDDIELNVVYGMNPSIYSDTNCDEWNKLKNAVKQTWPKAIVSPYLMMACTDSRHFCRITDRVYRFSAMRMSKEERAMVHGKNERIPIETLLKTVEFYITFIKTL